MNGSHDENATTFEQKLRKDCFIKSAYIEPIVDIVNNDNK